jgi:hypothetical protein
VTKPIKRWVGVGILAAALAAPATATENDPVVQDVLDILKERGIVEEGQYNELTAKNQLYEEEEERLLGRIEFSGDFRFRLENFWYDRDALGDDRDNRTRMRYRLRLKAKARVNDYTDVVFRLASGEALNFDEGANRSTNRTLGRGADFNLDPVFLDMAYVEMRAPADWVEGLSLKGTGGKTYNPFRWKDTRDYMIFDADITPEGVGLLAEYSLDERWQLFFNTGYFVLDENSTSTDPSLFGLQGGTHVDVAEDWKLGARLSGYSWGQLDESFYTRAASFGNIVDGLSSSAPDGGSLWVVEFAGYLRYDGIEGWPILLFGHYAKNLDAVASDLFPAAGKEDTGWGIGVEVGDKKRLVALGLGYYHLEANFSPAQFIDSDLLDGLTNRAGWALSGTRQILPSTEIAVTLFLSNPINRSFPAFEESVANADRIRLQTDLKVKF